MTAVGRPLTTRQAATLAALGRASGGEEWVTADTLVFGLRQAGHDVSAIGIGSTLAALAKKGHCEQRRGSYMSSYRSLPPAEEGQA